jgi:hypothetical protein
MTADSILARMDAALAKAEAQKLEPSAFYLTREDWDRFNAELSADWGSPCFGHSWRKVQIREGKESKLYTWHGTGIAIPKRAPPVDRRRNRGQRKAAAEIAQQPVERKRRA